MIKWQSESKILTFEPVSTCNWLEKLSNIFSTNFSFVSFANSNQTLTLFDPIKKSYAILNNEGYLYGRNIDSMILLETGKWVDNPPKQSNFDDAVQTCQFSEDKICN